jgi:hypothetical protein
VIYLKDTIPLAPYTTIAPLVLIGPIDWRPLVVTNSPLVVIEPIEKVDI